MLTTDLRFLLAANFAAMPPVKRLQKARYGVRSNVEVPTLLSTGGNNMTSTPDNCDHSVFCPTLFQNA